MKFIKILFLSGLFVFSVVTADPKVLPSNPWNGEDVRYHLAELQACKDQLQELIATSKVKTNDIGDVLKSDPYLKTLPISDGSISFVLKSPDCFVKGNSLTLKFVLRKQETQSGPARKEFNEPLIRYLKVVEETIKYYLDILRVMDRKIGVLNQEPYGLSIYERPSSSNGRLTGLYSQLWRDLDGNAGGTAGILLIEARNGQTLTHLEKARTRSVNLRRILKEEMLSKEDRKIAELVLADLRTAINEATFVEAEYLPESDASLSGDED